MYLTTQNLTGAERKYANMYKQLIAQSRTVI